MDVDALVCAAADVSLMVYNTLSANKARSLLNAIGWWWWVLQLQSSGKWCKMSHRDANIRRIQSWSGRVRCSPQIWRKGAAGSCSASPPPGAPRSPARSRSGCSVLWETDRKRPFLFGSLCSLSAQRTATGWKMSRLRVSDGVFRLKRREEEEAGEEEEEEWWWWRCAGRFRRVKTRRGLLAPLPPSLHPSSSSSSFTPPPPYHTHKTPEKKKKKKEKTPSIVLSDITPPSSPTFLPILAAAALLSSRDNSGEEPW